MTELRRFYSDFAVWLDRWGLQQPRRRRFMDALRRAAENELPARDGQFEILARNVVNSEEIRFSYSSDHTRVFPAQEDELAIAVIGPDWGKGWSGISRDELVRDEISSFFHFARQYVHRSRAASVLAALAAVYDRGCDSRGHWMVSRRIASVADPTMAIAGLVSELSADDRQYRGKRARRATEWIRRTNALDPFVHRAVFQFVKAKRLSTYGFDEEMVTALDGVVSVALQFLQHRVMRRTPTRRDLTAAFDMPAAHTQRLEQLYTLRCDFGAHPGWSKWWDFGEVYQDEFPKMFDAVERVLVGLTQAEASARLVDPDPPSWSAWFAENALHVYEAVWFHNIA